MLPYLSQQPSPATIRSIHFQSLSKSVNLFEMVIKMVEKVLKVRKVFWRPLAARLYLTTPKHFSTKNISGDHF
jgi:hypothetical protein